VNYRRGKRCNTRWDATFQEGDGRTPEGNYVIDWRKQDSVFHRALHISYPNAEDRKRARELSACRRRTDVPSRDTVSGAGDVGSVLGRTQTARLRES
jgi:hypothetical protein